MQKILMSGFNPHFTQWYSCVIDKTLDEFSLQTEEVAEIKRFTKDELVKLLQNRPDEFVNNVFDWVTLFVQI